MSNRARGEGELRAGTRTLKLCLTLGALAEIETALCVQSLAEIEAKLARPRASDLLAIIAALARGAGETIGEAELASLPLDLRAAAHAIRFAFSGGEEPARGEGQANGPFPGGAGSKSR